MLREEIRAISSTRRDLRNFGLVVGAVFAAIGGVLLWKGRPTGPYLAGAGAILVVFGAVAPTLLRPLQKVWMTIAVVMGWVMTRVILTVVYFLALTPIALAARAVGKAFLERRVTPGPGTYWEKKETGPSDRKKLEQQF